MVSTLTAMRDRRDRADELIAAGEVIDLRFPDGARALSARASQLFHLLLEYAAREDLTETTPAGEGTEATSRPALAPPDGRLHRIPIAWLRNTGIGHLAIPDFVACLRELASVTIDVEVRDEPGRAPHVKTGSYLSHIERDLDAARGVLLYEFSRTMRYVLERSSYWAVLDRRATLSFESRYAIRLYELMSLRGARSTPGRDLHDRGSARPARRAGGQAHPLRPPTPKGAGAGHRGDQPHQPADRLLVAGEGRALGRRHPLRMVLEGRGPPRARRRRARPGPPRPPHPTGRGGRRHCR